MVKKVAIISLIGLFGLVTSAFSLSYTTVAGDSGPGAGITYTLDYNLVSGTTYSATFKITETLGDVAPDWYVGWVIFKLNGTGPITISSLNAPGVGPWSVAYGSSTVNVLGGGGKYKSLLPATPQDFTKWSGFYVTSLAQNGATDDPTQGIHLTDDAADPAMTSTFTFDFTLQPGSTPNSEDIPFKVGYYDPPESDGKYIVNQLSQHLTVVPEPSTLLLLGAGLVGFGILGRRKFRS